VSTKEKKAAIQITRKGVAIWIGLIFFVMGWMFVLGIMVGRGTAPVPLRTYALEKELAALKAGMLQKEREQLDFQAKDSEAQSTELGFYEELKKPPTQTEPRRPSAPSPTTIPAKTSSVNPAAQKPPSGATATGSAATPPPQSAPSREMPSGEAKPAPAPAPAPVPAPAPAAAPAPKPAPSPAPAPAKPAPAPKPEPARVVQPAQQAAAAPAAQPAAASVDRGRFTIQVAAFQEIRGAEQMVGTLRSKGYPAYQIQVTVPGKGEWYRVRVGAFESREAAEATLKKLSNDQVRGMVIGTN
jgi:cell division septation protein DedD